MIPTQDKIGNKSRIGFAWDMTGSMIMQVSTLIVSIILARLLEPNEFGLIGMALVFVSLSQVFVDGGFTDGLIQEKEVSQSKYSSIFYVNIFISILFAILIFLLAPLIGKFYENDEVGNVLQYLVLVLPISALGRVHAARLVKGINFKALTLRGIISTIIGGIVGVIAAFKNQGVYSLIYQQITKASFDTLLLWYGSKWKPSLVFSWKEVKDMFYFSSFVFFDNLLTKFFQKIDTLFIGKVFSAAVLGFYSRAESLNAQVMTYSSSSIRRVMYPAFSAVKNDETRFKDIYFRAFSLSAIISSTLAGIIFFLADKIIIFLLGEKWIPSIILFQILVFRSLFAPFNGLMSRSLLSKGFSKLKFKMSLVQRTVMLLPLLTGFYFGIKVFTLTVVFTYFFSFLFHSFIFDRFMNVPIKLTLKKFINPMVPLFVSVLSFTFIFPDFNSYLKAIVFIGFQFVYLRITNDKGYILMGSEIKNINNKLFNKFSKKS